VLTYRFEDSLGLLEKSPIERIRSQTRADAEVSLNCCVPLELEYFEVPFGKIIQKL